MLYNVGNVIFWPRMVENVGVTVGIASPSVSVQKFFSTSGSVADILSFGCRHQQHARAMSGVPTRMIYCHVHAQIHEIPVQNSDIPSLWNCLHFLSYPRYGTIPFPVTCKETMTSLLLRFVWSSIL